MLIINIEIMSLSWQRAMVITNVEVTNANSIIKQIFGNKPTLDAKFARVNRFNKSSYKVTKIFQDTAMIWKSWIE